MERDILIVNMFWEIQKFRSIYTPIYQYNQYIVENNYKDINVIINEKNGSIDQSIKLSDPLMYKSAQSSYYELYNSSLIKSIIIIIFLQIIFNFIVTPSVESYPSPDQTVALIKRKNITK